MIKDEIKTKIAKGVLALISVFGFWLVEYAPDMILEYKQEKMVYGGSKSEADKLEKERNEKELDLKSLEKEITVKYNEIYVYTNDTINEIEATLEANIEYKQPLNLMGTFIEDNKNRINDISNFINNKDSLGYRIIATNAYDNQEFELMNTNDYDRNYKYKVTYFYYYDDETKERLKSYINDRPSKLTPIYQQIADLDKIRFSKVLLTEEELFSNELQKTNLERLVAPRIKASQKGAFYFSCYNKPMDSLTFSKRVEFFKTMFLRNYNNTKNQGVTRVFSANTN